jgi:hypothetical protein
MLALLRLAFLLLVSTQIPASPLVYIERVPDGGIQPRLVSDAEGGVHLLYFKKTGTGRRDISGNLVYRRLLSPGKWSPATVVSATFVHNDATGRASMAIDEDNRLHIVWFVLNPTGYWYTRSTSTGFEPPVSLVTENLEGVEAQASIAVHEDLVTINWHAGDLRAESRRQIYSIDSDNGGDSFDREIAISDPALGACACCGLTSSYRPDGKLDIAYRSAINDTGRHMQLLSGSGASASWRTNTLSEWQLNTCPLSTNDMKDPWLVFETRNRIYRTNFSIEASPLRVSNHEGEREKHPAIAVNSSAQQLIAWGEGSGYFEGGALHVAMYDAQNRLMETPDTTGLLIPNFSNAAALALADGNFLLVY